MVSFAIQKEIGAVGAKLLYKDETILHGGLIVGINDSVGIAHHKLPNEKGGYFSTAQVSEIFRRFQFLVWLSDAKFLKKSAVLMRKISRTNFSI